VDRVVVCSPDKDLAQCVRGSRVVQLDRRRAIERDEAGVIAKFGVAPHSIPDYLALVGDAADGYPGIPGWGAKSTAAVLRRYRHIEEIPSQAKDLQAGVTSPAALVQALQDNYQLALLFRELAILRVDVPVFDSVDQLRWRGPTPAFAEIGTRLDAAVIEKPAERPRRGQS
jgi:5'-3' exonuclease